MLIGRPYVIAAYGGGAEGVVLYTEKLETELQDAMTNCATLAEITKDKIIKKKIFSLMFYKKYKEFLQKG